VCKISCHTSLSLLKYWQNSLGGTFWRARYTTDLRPVGGNPCPRIADCAVVKQTRKFLTWAQPEPKSAVLPVSCTLPAGKSFTVNQQYRWKAYAPKGCLLGISTHQMSTTPNEEPQRRKKSGFENSFRFSCKSIRSIQWWNYLKSEQKRRRYRQKLCARAAPGQAKTTIARN